MSDGILEQAEEEKQLTDNEGLQNEEESSSDGEILEEEQEGAIKNGYRQAFGSDLHPDKDLMDAWAWNVECIVMLTIFSVLFVI